MGVGVSIFTITLGLILKFAIAEDAMTDPVDIHVIGVILIIVGGASFALQLLLMMRMQRRSPEPGGRLLRNRYPDPDNDRGTPDNHPPA
ncbi:hypothetical protein Acsp03_63240 [Actinomadura sp. NBRC 104412]|uniref:DUF6458 family protein n=1 Tax=Actinomadura sp. NBRC 104412 TaxID=3032203 RepID=UPI0024A38C6A|nr:DUF6458 family protein [Actinomadura sp. NBRC 104412]GLZ08858.1 hypothetical protein Acsp03_63240 [Actinomadura sp. NBRC 104412]